MRDKRKTKDQLIDELLSLRERMAHLEAERAQPPFESAPRHGEFHLAAMPENTADCVWIVDRQYRLLWGNDPFRDNIRASFGREIAPGDCVLIDEIPAEARDAWRGYYDRALRGEQLGVAHAAELTPHPQIMDYQLHPISANNRVVGVVVAGHDITAPGRAEDAIHRLGLELEQRVAERTRQLTEANAQLQADNHQRQRIEELLHKSELRYRALFENAGDAIFLVDLSGRIIEVNHMASQQLGYTRDELKGMPLNKFDASPEVASVDERIHRLLNAGAQTFEAVHRRRDGGLVPVEIKSRLVEYADSPAVLGVVRDVTERKQAEQALRRYADEQASLYRMSLLLSAQLDVTALLQLIVEQAVGLLGANAGGIYLYDAQLERLVLTLGSDYFSPYLGVNLRPGEGLSGRAFQTRQVMKVSDYQTWEGRAAVFGHEERFKLLMAVPLPGKHAVLGVLIVSGGDSKEAFDDHDARLAELFAAQAAITLENAQLHVRQHEQFRRLQEAQMRLIQAEKMSALGRLVASIVHEINNPLQAVQGCLTLARESIEDRPQFDSEQASELLHDLDVAASEVTRVAGIVQRLRDFYRPARAGTQLVDVNALIEAVLALTAKQLQHSRIELDRALTAYPLVIMTNADQIRQVCLNLILNAIDAMPQGGRLRVATQLTGDPGDTAAPDNSPAHPMVRIDFADTGNGISPDVLPQIFEPFFTTKDTGSGLGLSISYEIVKALGGGINVASELRHGSTFTIWLPIKPDPAETPSEVTA